MGDLFLNILAVLESLAVLPITGGHHPVVSFPRCGTPRPSDLQELEEAETRRAGPGLIVGM